jgi:sugar/nucleoside kinase (ribokinase family)
MNPSPDYLVIGHVTKDLFNGSFKIGGTATYSALTAHRLGHRVGIVTSKGSDIDLGHLPADIRVSACPSATSTTFENLYRDGHRQQHIWSQASLLTGSHIPPEWSNSPIVHLGPVAQEVDPLLAGCFPNALLGVTPQGWMRRWDDTGRVRPEVWKPSGDLLRRADAVILSREDVGEDIDLVRDYASQARLLVLTAGWRGATIYYHDQVRSFPAPAMREQDPTGAGDIFATVFLVALHKTSDPWLSAQFANCVASHSVERSGWDSIPTAQEIESCRQAFGGLLQGLR